MTPPSTPTPAVAAPGGIRTITEIGPFVGATSLAVGTGLVFISADGTWGSPTR